MPTLPLHNKRIVITRDEARAVEAARRLTRLGALPLVFPTIRIAPIDEPAPIDRVAARLSRYDWVVFTSANGVSAFWDRLAATGVEATAFETRFAAVGSETARSLIDRGPMPTVIPNEYTGVRLVEALGDIRGMSILLLRGELAPITINEQIKKNGARLDAVTVYQTIRPKPDQEVAELMARGFDAVLFTSGSTVRNFSGMVDTTTRKLLDEALVACIGPSTADVARDLGLSVGVVSPTYTMNALVESVATYYNRRTITRSRIEKSRIRK